MSEIKLVKRIKYAGDVHAALMELGWDSETAAAFLDSIPDVDKEDVFKHLDLMEEAFEMAKSSLAPVRHSFWESYDTSAFGGYKDGEVHWLARKFYRCERCRKGSAIRSNYCPNCGAKMGGCSDDAKFFVETVVSLRKEAE